MKKQQHDDKNTKMGNEKQIPLSSEDAERRNPSSKSSSSSPPSNQPSSPLDDPNSITAAMNTLENHNSVQEPQHGKEGVNKNQHDNSDEAAKVQELRDEEPQNVDSDKNISAPSSSVEKAETKQQEKSSNGPPETDAGSEPKGKEETDKQHHHEHEHEPENAEKPHRFVQVTPEKKRNNNNYRRGEPLEVWRQDTVRYPDMDDDDDDDNDNDRNHKEPSHPSDTAQSRSTAPHGSKHSSHHNTKAHPPQRQQQSSPTSKHNQHPQKTKGTKGSKTAAATAAAVSPKRPRQRSYRPNPHTRRRSSFREMKQYSSYVFRTTKESIRQIRELDKKNPWRVRIRRIIWTILLGGIILACLYWFAVLGKDHEDFLNDVVGFKRDDITEDEIIKNDPYTEMSPQDVKPWETKGQGLLLEVVNALEAKWHPYFDQAVLDWDDGYPDALKLRTSMEEHDFNCTSIPGKVKVCNGNYGETGWRGINNQYVVNGYIRSSISKMNEFYTGDPTTDDDEMQYVMCHELGHAWGLPHSDENFDNPPLGNCMDYTDNLAASRSPDSSNYEFLYQLYGLLPEAAPFSLPPNEVPTVAPSIPIIISPPSKAPSNKSSGAPSKTMAEAPDSNTVAPGENNTTDINVNEESGGQLRRRLRPQREVNPLPKQQKKDKYETKNKFAPKASNQEKDVIMGEFWNDPWLVDAMESFMEQYEDEIARVVLTLPQSQQEQQQQRHEMSMDSWEPQWRLLHRTKFSEAYELTVGPGCSVRIRKLLSPSKQ